MTSEAQQERSQPYLGQRCHIERRGFGTIIALREDTDGNHLARVRLDAGRTQWYEVEKLELLPTYPAG